MHKHHALLLLVWWRIKGVLSLVFIAWSAVAYAVSEIFHRNVERASHPICLIRKRRGGFTSGLLPRQWKIFRQWCAVCPDIHAPDVFQVKPHAGAFAHASPRTIAVFLQENQPEFALAFTDSFKQQEEL